MGIALGLIFASRIHAQEALVTQRILSLEVAKTIAEAALVEYKSKGAHPTVAVVDRAGLLMVLLRDEKSTPETIRDGLAQGLHCADFPYHHAGVSGAHEKRIGREQGNATLRICWRWVAVSRLRWATKPSEASAVRGPDRRSTTAAPNLASPR